MNFQDSYAQSGLEAALPVITELSPLGRPHLPQEAADLAIAVSKLEAISPTLVCFTHLTENSFKIKDALPNHNGKPGSPWNFDIGPFQLSLRWSMRSVFQGEFKSSDLLFVNVFGHSFYEVDGVTPCAFNGRPVDNGRLAARILLSKGKDDATRAVKFTGPDHQEKRAALWDSFSLLFSTVL